MKPKNMITTTLVAKDSTFYKEYVLDDEKFLFAKMNRDTEPISFVFWNDGLIECYVEEAILGEFML